MFSIAVDVLASCNVIVLTNIVGFGIRIMLRFNSAKALEAIPHLNKMSLSNIDIAKVASASANDYPLLEYVKTLNKPVVASTGGLRMDEVDRLVFTFKDLSKEFVLMHCVSIYPCPSDKLNMNQITNFKNRFNDLRVGFSTHENQDDYLPVALATSLGATLFEIAYAPALTFVSSPTPGDMIRFVIPRLLADQ
mgnify:CR=1 FL=1